jgi:hypothetical protein
MKSMLTLTDTSQDTSRETTPSGSKASGEFENENEDDFRDQEYDPVGPVNKTTESHSLNSLAALGVQIEEHSMTTFSPWKVISRSTIPSPINPSSATQLIIQHQY